MIQIIRRNKFFLTSCFAVFLLLLYIYYLLYQRIGAFGCFDDCNSIATGFFINQGRDIYSEIFHNHQPIMAFISSLVQQIIPTNSLYLLIATHRLAIFGIFIVLATALVVRFRWIGLGFLALYEPLKYYMFGDRFLAEAIIPYLAAYVIGLIFEKIVNKKLTSFDYYTGTLFSWLIIFLREPYMPLGAFLLFCLLINKKLSLIRWKQILFFLILTLGLFSILPIRDYIQTVYILNAQTIAADGAQQSQLFGIGMLRVVFYPLYSLLKMPTSYLGILLNMFSLLFITGIGILIYKKKYLLAVVLWTAQAISAIRYVEPGKMYYEAFHMIPWYGVFIMSIVIMIVFISKTIKDKKMTYGAFALVISISIFSLVSKGSFIHEKVDRAVEFNTGFAKYQKYASVINTLSDPSDTLYVEIWDDIMYPITGLESSYQYALYTPWTKDIKRYDQARLSMFSEDPPDIYYCSEEYAYKDGDLSPAQDTSAYIQTTQDDNPLCLYIHRDKFEKTSEEKWDTLENMGISYAENE